MWWRKRRRERWYPPMPLWWPDEEAWRRLCDGVFADMERNGAKADLELIQTTYWP